MVPSLTTYDLPFPQNWGPKCILGPTSRREVWCLFVYGVVSSTAQSRQFSRSFTHHSHGLHRTFLQQYDDRVVQNLGPAGASNRHSALHVRTGVCFLLCKITDVNKLHITSWNCKCCYPMVHVLTDCNQIWWSNLQAKRVSGELYPRHTKRKLAYLLLTGTVCRFVRPSVCHDPTSCQNGVTYRQNYFTSHNILFFWD